jgi:tRNA A-37 threonylcarbamoyl transferase component Bud32
LKTPVDLARWSIPEELSVVRPIGEGAFGKVFLVNDRRHEPPRNFALKVFSPVSGMDLERAKNRFLNGADLMKDRLRHPGIVHVHEVFGRNTESPAFLMDYIQGQDLDAHVREAESLSPTELRELLECMAEVADAVGAAHRQDIIHRDIKPRNILLSRASGQLRAVLTDFDLAYKLGQNLTATIGSPLAIAQTGTYYMHPEFRQHFDRYASADEQLAARHKRLDYYSICATLFFVLTGEEPSSEGRMHKLLEDVEQHLARALGGTSNLQKIRALIFPALESATVMGVPQNVSDIASELRVIASGSPRRLKAAVAGTLALVFGRPISNVAQLRAEYHGHEVGALRSRARARGIRLAIILMVSFAGWVLGFEPIELTGLTLISALSFTSARELADIVANSPAVLTTWARVYHHGNIFMPRLQLLILAYYAIAAGAFVLVPSVQPWFIGFREQMLSLRQRIHSRPLKSVELVAPIASQAPTPLRVGDRVRLLQIVSPTEWRVASAFGEQVVTLWGLVPSSERRPAQAEKFRAWALSGPAPSLRVAHIEGTNGEARMRLVMEGNDVGELLLRIGIAELGSESDTPAIYRTAQRTAQELGRGMWKERGCDFPCSAGANCATARTSCSTGWYCVPEAAELHARRWTIFLMGAEVGDTHTDAKVCVAVGGLEMCRPAQAAALSESGLSMEMTLSGNRLTASRARVWMEATARGTHQREVVLERRTNLLVSPESICKGFFFSAGGGRVRLRLRQKDEDLPF